VHVVVWAGKVLYVPAGQAVQVPALAAENVLLGHMTAVLLRDPAGQVYPAEQVPVQVAEVAPGAAPYRPAGHRLHTPALPTENCPAGQMADAFVLPAGQKYLQCPREVHHAEATTKLAMKRGQGEQQTHPAGHSPEHATLAIPDSLP
jgi:hypothetical protein